jgi:hypothetical protein
VPVALCEVPKKRSFTGLNSVRSQRLDDGTHGLQEDRDRQQILVARFPVTKTQNNAISPVQSVEGSPVAGPNVA